MFGELLSELSTNQKMEIVKYATVFAGGMVAGYSIKKVLDSYDFDVIKNNASNLFDEYINPKIRYVDNIDENFVDEEDRDM